MMKTPAPHIWMINHAAITPDMPGGTRHHDFAVELIRYGCKVTIFATDLHYTTRQRTKLHRFNLWQAEEYNGVRFIWVRSASYQENNWRRLLSMLSFAFNTYLVGAKMQAPDVIIGSSPHLLAAFSAYRLARHHRTKFIFEVRDLWPQALIDTETAGENSLSVKVLRWIETRLYQDADKIVVLAEGSKEYICDRGFSPNKILFIPNGVHLGQFQVTEDREAVRKRMAFDNKFIVMYAGAHGPMNALHTIVQVADKLRNEPEIEFILVGDGPSKNKLQKMAVRKQLTNIRFVDSVPKKEIPNLLNAADVLAITLRAVDLCSYSVSPNKLFDYMAVGKPIICAVSGDMANLVQKASAGITVAPEEPQAFAQALVQLRQSPTQRVSFGTNGRRFIAQNFSRQELVKLLYRSFLI